MTVALTLLLPVVLVVVGPLTAAVAPAAALQARGAAGSRSLLLWQGDQISEHGLGRSGVSYSIWCFRVQMVGSYAGNLPVGMFLFCLGGMRSAYGCDGMWDLCHTLLRLKPESC